MYSPDGSDRVVITACPCGTPHEVSSWAWEVYQKITRGRPATVILEIPDGRRWQVPRIFIAMHHLKTADVPGAAGKYGFEPVLE